MYTPKDFLLEDRDAALDIIRRNSFGLLVTAPEGTPRATHLPFLYDAERGERGTIVGHMARANPQWRDFETLAAAETLVVFQGPHAYVSPSWYGGDQPAVPTWNYMAVHAYGRPRIMDDPVEVRALLERLVTTHEAGLAPPWSLDSQDEAFVAAMMRAIVAFEIPVARLEAKAKLSQNRTAEQRVGVVAALEAEEDPLAREVARQMRVLVG